MTAMKISKPRGDEWHGSEWELSFPVWRNLVHRGSIMEMGTSDWNRAWVFKEHGGGAASWVGWRKELKPLANVKRHCFKISMEACHCLRQVLYRTHSGVQFVTRLMLAGSRYGLKSCCWATPWPKGTWRGKTLFQLPSPDHVHPEGSPCRDLAGTWRQDQEAGTKAEVTCTQ